MPVFAYSGVTCERCHGPGAAHVNGGAIVNPAKLAPDRRDAVCMQCHLEGNAAIERPGKHLYEFRPGDDLSDYVRYYIKADNNASGLRAASQFEALAQSTCKKKVGRCNVVYELSRSASVSVARGASLVSIARNASRVTGRVARETSCRPAGLHFVPHACPCQHRRGSYGGHRSPDSAPSHDRSRCRECVTRPLRHRLPCSRFQNTARGTRHDIRDLALAWASAAESGDAAVRSSRLSNCCAKRCTASPKDSALLSSLAYLEQKAGDVSDSRELYQRALAQDPTSLDAATNLGVIEANQRTHARSGDIVGERFPTRAPGRSSIGMNMAHAFCSAGKIEQARDFTMRVLQFNPDLDSAKKLLRD